MAQGWHIEEDTEGVTHIGGCGPGGEFTACGYAYDNAEDYIPKPATEKKKVTCPDCCTEVRFYHSIPKNILTEKE